jgi:hypothetical protein
MKMTYQGLPFMISGRDPNQIVQGAYWQNGILMGLEHQIVLLFCVTKYIPPSSASQTPARVGFDGHIVSGHIRVVDDKFARILGPLVEKLSSAMLFVRLEAKDSDVLIN